MRILLLIFLLSLLRPALSPAQRIDPTAAFRSIPNDKGYLRFQHHRQVPAVRRRAGRAGLGHAQRSSGEERAHRVDVAVVRRPCHPAVSRFGARHLLELRQQLAAGAQPRLQLLRITHPVVGVQRQLARHMSQLGKEWPEDLDPKLYTYRDEMGRLFEAYNLLLTDLKAKAVLENRMVQADRLAALGQLAAGIAHEINNPLSGMLMAIDTLKCHTDISPMTNKTISLIERGLTQIKETVSALLVGTPTEWSQSFAAGH